MIRPVLIAAVGHEVATKAEVVATAGAGVAAFMAMEWSMIIFGVPNTVLFASFLGAVVSLSVLSKTTKWGMFGALVCGTLSGGFLTPAVAGALDARNYYLSVGFGIGLVAHLVLSVLFKNFGKWANDFIASKMGGKQ